MLHRTFNFRAALMLAPLLALAGTAASAQAQLATLASNDTIRESSSSQPADSRPRGLVTREELIVDRLQRLGIDNPDPYPRKPSSRADSVRWERDRRQAWGGEGRRVIVSVYERMLWVAEDGDTLLSAPVGVGMGVARKGRFSYDFSTPLGRRTVLAKEENPIWTPPDWHYWGQARRVRPFPAGGVALADGRRVVRRGDKIGFLADGEFEQIPPERDLLFDGVLYIPPFGTVNRQIPDVLGRFKLDTGDGILIHGTNDPVSIGFPATHGCIRLDDAELEELYALVPVGTQVFIY